MTIADPDALDLSIQVNGQMKQDYNARHLVHNVQRLIDYAPIRSIGCFNIRIADEYAV
jgi:2-keto-4-pentenoate hydratase/2-oxohepta-3-ene-1,7-dioic acid hydratase in catechol pathway